jgi:hypothetical protein
MKHAHEELRHFEMIIMYNLFLKAILVAWHVDTSATLCDKVYGLQWDKNIIQCSHVSNATIAYYGLKI